MGFLFVFRLYDRWGLVSVDETKQARLFDDWHPDYERAHWSLFKWAGTPISSMVVAVSLGAWRRLKLLNLQGREVFLCVASKGVLALFIG